MFKTVNKDVQVFDVKQGPDSQAGRMLFELPKDTSDFKVLKKIWEEGVADKENPTPYLKT